MQQLSSGTLLDAVRGVHWPARRVTRGLYAGGHRSRRVGSSPEFMEYRPYRKGDEASRIDWKLFGRTERVAIRVTHDDSSFKTMVLLDASASMAFPPGSMDKWELAAAISLGLCAVANGDNDPVGIAVVDEGVGRGELRMLPPRTKRGHVANVLNLLTSIAPGGSTPMASVLASLRANRRIAIVSDFLGDTEALLELGRELVASGREVFAVHIVAAEELNPQSRGNVVVDPEDDEIRRPLDGRGVNEYKQAFARWREHLGDAWRQAGVYYAMAVTDEPAEQAIRRVVTPTATAHESW